MFVCTARNLTAPWGRMLQFTTQTDPETSRPVTTSLDRFFVSLLNDPRDLPFIYLGLRVTFTLIPMAVLLYMPPTRGPSD